MYGKETCGEALYLGSCPCVAVYTPGQSSVYMEFGGSGYVKPDSSNLRPVPDMKRLQF